MHLDQKVAAQYLIKAKERLGSWTLAAAAYNAGNYGIAKRLKTLTINKTTSKPIPNKIIIAPIMKIF